MNETLKISVHRFPRLSVLLGSIFFLSILICVNSEVLGEARTASLEDPMIMAILGIGTASATLWFLLQLFKSQWIFERPLRIGHRTPFQSHARFLELPSACTLLRQGRKLLFMDANQAHPRMAPAGVGHEEWLKSQASAHVIATLFFSSQRKAILSENRLLEFLDPDRRTPAHTSARSLRLVGLAPVTFALIALNVAISVYAWTRGDAFVMRGALSRATIQHGEYYRLISNTFLHFNGLHLIMNMFALWSLGVQVERIVGRIKMILIYLISGVCGGLWALQFIGSISLLGASGAVFGLFGAIAYFIFLGRDQLPATVYLPTKRQLSTDLLINAGLSLLPFVSFSAHFGGFIAGFVSSGLLARLRIERTNAS